MTARFSVLKNVLSGRFNARDDFWVVQVAKKPSQFVFVPSMAISQQDRIAVPFPELPPRACRRPEVVDGLRSQDQLFQELVPIRPGDLLVLQGPLAWFSSRITISVKLACGGLHRPFLSA